MTFKNKQSELLSTIVDTEKDYTAFDLPSEFHQWSARTIGKQFNDDEDLLPSNGHQDEVHGATYYEEGGRKNFKAEHKQEELNPIKVEVGQGLIFPSTLIHESLPQSMLGQVRCSAELILAYLSK